MSTQLSDLRVHKDGGAGCKHPPATTENLVAALIAEGGEIQEVVEKILMYDTATSQFGEVQVLSQLWPRHGAGRYLVFPLPVESAEAKETSDSRDTGEKPDG